MTATHADGAAWAIATPEVEASRAGAEAFERGGSAVDAALTAATALAVTYPHMCGVGGDLFAVVRRADGELFAVNASGRAPAAVDPEALRAAHGHTVPARGPVPVTVPGAVSGWSALHRLAGERPWAEAFARAIALAHDGTTVPASLGRMLAGRPAAALLEADAGLADVFAPSGAPLDRGDRLIQPALGRTLEALAAGGAEALYRGPIGAAFVRGLRATGSPISEEDLAAHEATVGPPLLGRFDVAGLHVAVVPPNSQGYALPLILGAIDRLGIDPDPHGTDADVLARVFLEALRDVRRHLAHPDQMTLHPSTLLADGHLRAVCKAASAPLAPVAGPAQPPGDTVALVAADAAGTVVTLIQSLSYGFGSGIIEPTTGILAHNRGTGFTLESDLPQTMQPGVRPPHTLLPSILLDERGVAVGAAGTMGGAQQPQINAQTIVHAFVSGRHPGDAVSAPRWIVDDIPDGEGLPDLLAEADVPDDVRDRLAAVGMPFDTLAPRDESVGHAHLLRRFDDRWHAGSDPRADGAAIAG